MWLLGTFVNGSCDIKINIENRQNCCIKSAVKGLRVLAHPAHAWLLGITNLLLLFCSADTAHLILQPFDVDLG